MGVSACFCPFLGRPSHQNRLYQLPKRSRYPVKTGPVNLFPLAIHPLRLRLLRLLRLVHQQLRSTAPSLLLRKGTQLKAALDKWRQSKVLLGRLPRGSAPSAPS